MLERDTFILRRQELGRWRCASYAITSAEGEPLGRAEEVVSFWPGLLRRVLGRTALPARVLLREVLDDSLLAILVHSGDLIRPRLHVRDSQHDPVGIFEPAASGQGYVIRNRDQDVIAHVEQLSLPWTYVSTESGATLGSAFVEGDRLVVHTRSEIADQPLVKLLLLAGSLWLDLKRDSA